MEKENESFFRDTKSKNPPLSQKTRNNPNTH